MKTLKRKVAIVTGASRGVGKGVALGLAEQGATIYITGRTVNDDGLPGFFRGTTIQQTAKEVNNLGGVGIAVQCDHTKDDEVEALFNQVIQEQNKLDILVNNAWAGANHAMHDYFWNAPFWEQPVSLFDDLYNVGLRSAYVASRYAAKTMTLQKSGLICNISFYSANRYWLNISHGLFKAGIDKLTADMAHELKEFGICVNSLYPGHVSTEGMLEAAKYNPSIDTSIMETPQFIGRCVAALACDDQAMKDTGSVLIAAEVAHKYSIKDINGIQPKSLRDELWLTAISRDS